MDENAEFCNPPEPWLSQRALDFSLEFLRQRKKKWTVATDKV